MGRYSKILNKVKRNYPSALKNANQFRGILKDEQCEKSVVKILSAFVEDGVPDKLASGKCTSNELNRLVKHIKTDNAFDDSVYEAMTDFAALYNVQYNYSTNKTIVKPTSVIETNKKQKTRVNNSTVSYKGVVGNSSKNNKKVFTPIVILLALILLSLIVSIIFWSVKDNENDHSAESDSSNVKIVEPAKAQPIESPKKKVGTTKSEKITLKANGIEFAMVKVKGGTFKMGCDGGTGCDGFVKPAHNVTIGDFYISETEVTQELWFAVMNNNPSKFKGKHYPVSNITKEDCDKFLFKLDLTVGKNFRLPTEAEWEFAAKGGNLSKHFLYSGSNSVNDVGWYKGNSSGRIHNVAQKKPNELGIYDMSGNVWEFCSDWFGDYPSYDQRNPKGPNLGEHYVVRGGSWNRESLFCMSMQRNAIDRRYSDNSIGLRIVMNVE